MPKEREPHQLKRRNSLAFELWNNKAFRKQVVPDKKKKDEKLKARKKVRVYDE